MQKRCMTHQGRGVQKRMLESIGGGCYRVSELGHFGRVLHSEVVRGYEQALIAYSFAAGDVVPDRKS